MSRPVVYIDDEAAICRLVDLRLRAQGLPVAAFTDPEAAIAFIARNDVAVVLCDFRMPAMNALDLLARIEKGIPFYIVTGDITLEDDVAGESRVLGLIPKPIPFERLIALIRALGEPAEES